jgi:protein TonB
MESEYILQSDLIDIVFEKRNKNYGAYIIRKFYKARLIKAIAITFSAAAAACFFLLLEKGRGTLIIPDIETARFQIAKPEVEKPKAPEKPSVKPPKVLPKLNTQAWVSNFKIVKDLPKSMLPVDLDSVEIASETGKGDPGVHPIITPVDDAASGPANTIATPVPAPTRDMVMETAEVMPSFPGGMEALRKFLQRNLQNPADLEQGQMVSVKIKFVVGYDGALKSFETLEDGGAPFNNEVIRVLKKMPKWLPGKTRGENVSVYYNIPVKFQGVE